MNSTLRRLFPLGLLLLCAAGIVHSIAALATAPGDPISRITNNIAWLAALCSCAAIPATFGYLLRCKRATSAASITTLHSVVALLPMAILYTLLQGKTVSYWPLFYTVVVGYGGTLLYTRWYCQLNRPVRDQLQPGQPLPAFTVQAADGSALSSLDIAQQKPVIWLFLRGDYSPLCQAQLRNFLQHRGELQPAELAIVSAQPLQSQRGASAAHWLHDADGKAATVLGIVDTNGAPLGLSLQASHSVYPTVLVSNAGGRILYANQTTHSLQRPAAEDVKYVLKALQPATREKSR